MLVLAQRLRGPKTLGDGMSQVPCTRHRLDATALGLTCKKGSAEKTRTEKCAYQEDAGWASSVGHGKRMMIPSCPWTGTHRLGVHPAVHARIPVNAYLYCRDSHIAEFFQASAISPVGWSFLERTHRCTG